MKRLLLIAALSLAFPVAGNCQFTVFDPTNFGEAVKEFTSLTQQYQQDEATYTMWRYQLSNMKNLSNRYYLQAVLWQRLALLNNTYGRAGAWQATANTGGNAAGSYTQATTPVVAMLGGAFSRLSPDAQQRAAVRYATVNLSDGAGTTGLGEVGDTRAAIPEIQVRIAALQSDSYSATPSLSTEIAVEQKNGAAQVIADKIALDREKIELSTLETNLIRAKAARDGMVDGMTTAAYGALSPQVTNASFSGLDDRINRFTVP
jgi:hypothetical protein